MLSALSKKSEELNIPLIIIEINGLFGCVRLQAGVHTMIESKPDGVFYDLRLIKPF